MKILVFYKLEANQTVHQREYLTKSRAQLDQPLVNFIGDVYFPPSAHTINCTRQRNPHMPIYREAKRLASGRSAQPAAQPDTREAEITEDNTSKECNKRYHHHNVTASYMCATVAFEKKSVFGQ